MKWIAELMNPRRFFRGGQAASDPPRMSESERRALLCRVEQPSHDPAGGFGIPINYVPRY